MSELENEIKSVHAESVNSLKEQIADYRSLADGRVSKGELQEAACTINSEMEQGMRTLRKQLVELGDAMKGKVCQEVHEASCQKVEDELMNITTAIGLKVSQDRFEELSAKVYEKMEPTIVACSAQVHGLQNALQSKASVELHKASVSQLEEQLANCASVPDLKHIRQDWGVSKILAA